MTRCVQTHDGHDEKTTGLDERDQRALQQYLTVLSDDPRVAGADDLYMVVSQSGKAYLVDARLGACECPDHEYRDARCKHIRRVAFAVGDEPIPAGVDGVDPDLGHHVDGPRVAATDGGQVAEADADDECEECAALPGQWPCATCAIQDGVEIPEAN